MNRTSTLVSEIFKDGRMDGRTHGQGRLLRTPSDEPGVQNIKFQSLVFKNEPSKKGKIPPL